MHTKSRLGARGVLVLAAAAALFLTVLVGTARPAHADEGSWACAASNPAVCGKFTYSGPGPIYTMTKAKVQVAGVGTGYRTSSIYYVVRATNGNLVGSGYLSAVSAGSTTTFDIPNGSFGNNAKWTMSGTLNLSGAGFTMCGYVRGGVIGVNSAGC